MKSHEKLLLAAIAGVFLLSLTLNVIFSDFPIGWDGFYHMRVLKLTASEQKFIPYDSISAGGRLQTYPPGYYALLLPLELLTGARADMIGRIISPVMGALTVMALFVLARRLFGETVTALLAILLFASSPEVLGSFVSFAMPQAVGHFLVASGIFAFMFLPAIFPMVALSLSTTHMISTVILLIYILIFTLLRALTNISRYDFQSPQDGFAEVWNDAKPGFQNPLFDWKNMKMRAAISVVLLLAFPLLWGRVLFPSYNLPTWGGVPTKLQDYIGAIGPLQVLLFILVLSSFSRIKKDGFSVAGVALLLLSRGSLLPARLLYHAILPLSISAAGFLKNKIAVSFGRRGPALAVILLSAYLLIGMAGYGNYASPQLNAQDMDALKWIPENTPESSTVLGYKDFSAVWTLYYSGRPTILDGYSEAVPDAYRRMEDEVRAYSSNSLDDARTALFAKYGVRYLFFDSNEEKVYKDMFNMTKFYGLPILIDNGYAKVVRA